MFAQVLLVNLVLLISVSSAFCQQEYVPALPERLPADGALNAGDTRGDSGLKALIDRALANNPDLSAASFEQAASEARSQSAFAARLPRLNIEGSANVYGDNLRLIAARYNGEVGVFGNNILATDLVLRLPLYSGGKLIAEQRAAELLAAASIKRLERNKQDLVYNVASFYYGILAQKKLLESLNFSEKTVTAQLERVNNLIAAGKAARVDALRLEVRLADIRQKLLREQNSLTVQQQLLENLVGGSRDAGAPNPAGELRQPVIDARPVSGLLAAALEQRRDISAFRTELVSQQTRVAAARAGHLPTVNLVGAVGWRQMLSPEQEPQGQHSGEDASRIGLSIDIPLFEGGRVNARVSEEQARLSAQRRRLDKLLLQVKLEVTTAKTNLDTALERIKSTGAAVNLARESLRIEEQKYSLGRGTVVDLLDAQNALLDAETNAIKALADANSAATQLAWATGENLP